jgi:hypothetical protein
LRTGELWVSFDGGWSGLRTIEALFNSAEGSVNMRLYNNALQEVALSAPTPTGAVLLYNGQLGQPYFLRLSGTNPNVSVHSTDMALPVGPLTASGEGATSDQPGASGLTPSEAETSSSDKFASAAVPMTEPAVEPLASSEASDEALGEGEDWVLEALLA